MKNNFLRLLFICLTFPLLNISCRKTEIKSPRAYFTYKIGYLARAGEPDEQCTAGDGVCDFELKENWRPSGPMPEGQGFGYLTITRDLKPQMVIYMPYLSTETYRKHYEDGMASLPGPWKLAARLTGKLGLIDGYTVSMGDYTIGLGNEDGYDVLIITF